MAAIMLSSSSFSLTIHTEERRTPVKPPRKSKQTPNNKSAFDIWSTGTSASFDLNTGPKPILSNHIKPKRTSRNVSCEEEGDSGALQPRKKHRMIDCEDKENIIPDSSAKPETKFIGLKPLEHRIVFQFVKPRILDYIRPLIESNGGFRSFCRSPYSCPSLAQHSYSFNPAYEITDHSGYTESSFKEDDDLDALQKMFATKPYSQSCSTFKPFCDSDTES